VYERISDHVADCMAVCTRARAGGVVKGKYYVSNKRKKKKGNSLAVGKIGKRALLVDDADGSLLGANAHALDVI
jgi:hypothetical protein